MEGKLNRLQQVLPEGLVADAAWLERHGYSPALRHKYVRHGWLESPARGVYRRPQAALHRREDGALRWQQVVISLQTLLGQPVTVGGRTALELQGFAHYLPAAAREVHLYGTEGLPAWVEKLGLDTAFVFHNARRLFGGELLLGPQERKSRKHGDTDPGPRLPEGLAVQPWGHWEWPLILSSPERAMLELLDELPARETFHQVDMLMEGLRNLSPRRLDKLLAACRSVKVKRLFLWFAERHDHAWLKALHREAIDLGHGKRMLVRGGHLDPKYNITVPEMPNAGL